MLFAILIAMVLATSASIWYGYTLSSVLFMITLACIATMFMLDIDTPLRLTF